MELSVPAEPLGEKEHILSTKTLDQNEPIRKIVEYVRDEGTSRYTETTNVRLTMDGAPWKLAETGHPSSDPDRAYLERFSK